MRVAQGVEQDANLFERELPSRLPGSRIKFGRHGIQLVDSSRVRHGKLQYRSNGERSPSGESPSIRRRLLCRVDEHRFHGTLGGFDFKSQLLLDGSKERGA